MPKESDNQVAALLAALTVHCSKYKGEYVERTIDATRLLMVWLSYLRASVSRRAADRLLDAAQAAIIETAGCLSLGLVRPAIFSIRAQLELVLAWIYFNDHPIEWSRFEKGKRRYELPANVKDYLAGNSDRYSERFKTLEARKTRKSEDIYGVLSVHVHSNLPYSAPGIGPLVDLVKSKATCDECIGLQADVTEFVGDVLASWYADRWHDLPREITSHLKARMSATKLKEFCR